MIYLLDRGDVVGLIVVSFTFGCLLTLGGIIEFHVVPAVIASECPKWVPAPAKAGNCSVDNGVTIYKC